MLRGTYGIRYACVCVYVRVCVRIMEYVMEYILPSLTKMTSCSPAHPLRQDSPSYQAYNIYIPQVRYVNSLCVTMIYIVLTDTQTGTDTDTNINAQTKRQAQTQIPSKVSAHRPKHRSNECYENSNLEICWLYLFINLFIRFNSIEAISFLIRKGKDFINCNSVVVQLKDTLHKGECNYIINCIR